MLSKKEIADKIKTMRTVEVMESVPLSQPTIDRAKRADMSPMTQWALSRFVEQLSK